MTWLNERFWYEYSCESMTKWTYCSFSSVLMFCGKINEQLNVELNGGSNVHCKTDDDLGKNLVPKLK